MRRGLGIGHYGGESLDIIGNFIIEDMCMVLSLKSLYEIDMCHVHINTVVLIDQTSRGRPFD